MNGDKNAGPRRLLQRSAPALLVIGFGAVGAAIGWRLFLVPDTPLPASPPRPTGAQSPRVTPPGASGQGKWAGGLSPRIQYGAPPPEFALPDLSGKVHTLKDHRGEVVIIDFWATWCLPCREEMPALEQAYETFKDQGLMIPGVNWTQIDDPDKVAPFGEELGLTFPLLLDRRGEVSGRLYRVIGLPTSLFIARDGTVRQVFIGPIPLDELSSTLEALLGQGPS